MSQAFVKEDDDNGLLHHVDPNIPALLAYLRAESGGKAIAELSRELKDGVEVITMSNGYSYFLNLHKEWEIIL